MSHHETVVVATFHHRHQAEMARGYLEHEDIPAVVTADDGGGAFGMPLTFSLDSFATVRVRQQEAEQAREVLENAGLLEPDEP